MRLERKRNRAGDRKPKEEASAAPREAGLRRAAAWARRPVPYHALLVAILVLAVAVRMPLVFEADDVFDGHADSGSYFYHAYAKYLDGRIEPMPHGGSGWPLFLTVAFNAAGLAADPSFAPNQEGPATEAQAAAILYAYAFHALLAVGLVVATYLLARLLVSPLMALGATALVAVDPFVLGQTTSVMADLAYATMLLLALACVLKARDNPAWLALAGSLMAFAHMLRVNGLVMLVMVLVFAALYLPRASERFQWRWIVAGLVVFFLVATPYLAWRGSHLPGPFDYGTNQRFFADDLWSDSPYWETWTYDQGGERETLRDYLATHSAWQIFERFYNSVQWQALDLTGFGSGPHQAPEGAALTPILLAFALVGWLAVAKRREWWFVPLALAFTLATFAWIYPVVRSVRYYTPIIPMVAILAVVGMREAGERFGRPLAATLGGITAFLALYAVRPVLEVPEGIAGVRATGLSALVLVMTSLWLLLAFAPSLVAAIRNPAFRRDPVAQHGDAARTAR